MSNGAIITLIICGTLLLFAVIAAVKNCVLAYIFNKYGGGNPADGTDAAKPPDPFEDFDGGGGQ